MASLSRAITALTLLCAGAIGCVNYVTVTVANRSDKSIRQVRVRYNGGAINIPELPGRTSQTFKIRPEGESSLAVTFIDTRGVARSKDADVYLERHYRGNVQIAIERDASVSIMADVKPE